MVKKGFSTRMHVPQPNPTLGQWNHIQLYNVLNCFDKDKTESHQTATRAILSNWQDLNIDWLSWSSQIMKIHNFHNSLCRNKIYEPINLYYTADPQYAQNMSKQSTQNICIYVCYKLSGNWFLRWPPSFIITPPKLLIKPHGSHVNAVSRANDIKVLRWCLAMASIGQGQIHSWRGWLQLRNIPIFNKGRKISFSAWRLL